MILTRCSLLKITTLGLVRAFQLMLTNSMMAILNFKVQIEARQFKILIRWNLIRLHLFIGLRRVLNSNNQITKTESLKYLKSIKRLNLESKKKWLIRSLTKSDSKWSNLRISTLFNFQNQQVIWNTSQNYTNKNQWTKGKITTQSMPLD